MARWEVVVGKWLGFTGMLAIYVTMMFGARSRSATGLAA